MGYNEAVRDNIRIEKPKSYYTPTLFYPLCYKCGAEVMTYNYLRSIKYQCKKCRTLEYMQDKEKRTEINNDAKEKKFEKQIEKKAESKQQNAMNSFMNFYSGMLLPKPKPSN